MPEKSGMDAALCVTPLAVPTARPTVCPKVDVAAAATNDTNKRKSRCLCMPNSLSWFVCDSYFRRPLFAPSASRSSTSSCRKDTKNACPHCAWSALTCALLGSLSLNLGACNLTAKLDQGRATAERPALRVPAPCLGPVCRFRHFHRLRTDRRPVYARLAGGRRTASRHD